MKNIKILSDINEDKYNFGLLYDEQEKTCHAMIFCGGLLILLAFIF